MKRLMTLLLPVLGLAAGGGAMALLGNGQETPALITGLVSGLMLCGGAMARTPTLGVAALGAYGAGLSAYLAVQHKVALAGGASVCNINDVLNCDLVNTSAWSEVGGVPIALFGLAFYSAITVVGVQAWRDRPGLDRAAAFILATSILALGVSLFLGAVSMQLGAFCILCVTTYIINALLVVAGHQALRGEPFMDQVPAALTGYKDRSLPLGLMGAVVGGLLGYFLYENTKLPPAAQAIEAVSEGKAESADYGRLYEQVAGKVNLHGYEPAWGKPDAPYTVVEFADYQCPHCAMMAKELKAVAAKLPELRVVYKHYPLSNVCNDRIPSSGHAEACMASAAAVCAAQQGRFWELNAQMFENQAVLSKENIRFMAQQVSLDLAALDTCMSDEATSDRVRSDVAHGWEAGVMATPSLFVKGLLDDPTAWVHITSGSEGLALLIEAKKKGVRLPAPRPPTPME
ncbi:thioredoxin domain-containing protein [Myxococcota bacterium]|nr:thioredoxin domain-containing protein [Myxococcota bacterium]